MVKKIIDYRLTVLEVEKEKRVVKVKKGTNVYLGVQVNDINESGFSDIKEVQDTIKEITEDIITIYDKNSFDMVTQSFKIIKKVEISEVMATELKQNEAFCLPMTDRFGSDANKRTNRLILVIRKSDSGKLNDVNEKIKAVKIINDFRESIGFNRTKASFKIGNNVIGTK